MNDTALDLPDLDTLPTLKDSDRLANLYESIGDAKARREELRERIETIQQEALPQAEEEVEETRVAVATGEQTEEDLQGVKAQRRELEEELEELTGNELKGQEDTVDLLEGRHDEIRSEEGDKLAAEYQEAQTQLQREKVRLLQRLAVVLDELDSYASLKSANDVGSYKPEVPQVPPVEPRIKNGPSEVGPFDLRKHAEDVESHLKTMEEDG